MATPSFLDSLPLGSYENGNVSSLTVSYTCPSGGSNRCLVVLFMGRMGAVTVTSAGYGGNALTSAGDNAATDMLVRCYRLLAPAAGAANIEIVLSGSARCGIIYGTLQDVDQAAPTRTGAGALNSNSTGAITTVVGDLLVGALADRDDVLSGIASPAGDTELCELLIDPTAGSPLYIATNAASRVADDVTETMTWTGGGPDWHGVFAVPFVGAAAASAASGAFYASYYQRMVA